MPLTIIAMLAWAMVIGVRATALVEDLRGRVDETVSPDRDAAEAAAVRVAGRAGYTATVTGHRFVSGYWFITLQASTTCLEVAWKDHVASAAPAIVGCEPTASGSAGGDTLDPEDARAKLATDFLRAWSTRSPVDRFTIVGWAPEPPPGVAKFTVSDVVDGGVVGNRSEIIVAGVVEQGPVARDAQWTVGLSLVGGKWFVERLEAVAPISTDSPGTTMPVTTTSTTR